MTSSYEAGTLTLALAGGGVDETASLFFVFVFAMHAEL